MLSGLTLKTYLILCVWWFYLHLSVHNMNTLSRRSEESIGSPGIRAIESCEPLCGCWELNLDSLVEEPVP